MSVLAWYTRKYSLITHNVNVSSKFSIDFKENIDLKMYHYTVGSKEQAKLPMEDVDEAIRIAKNLQDTTQRKESRQAIKNVLDYCEKLEKRMYNIGRTDSYDSRQEQLNHNIYVLTNLIQGKMTDYIYYEAGYLSTIEQQVMRDIIMIIICMAILIVAIVTLILYRSFHFTEGIVKPISDLCDNVTKLDMGISR
jgi:two-component system sensor histidine kinase YesM